MAVTIDEVTAEVVPPETQERQAPAAATQPSPEAQRRRHRELTERMQQRAMRLKAD
jgi:hypothetical protein